MKNDRELTDIITDHVQIYGNEYDVFFFGSARAMQPGPKRKPKRKENTVLRLKAKKL
jgi:hypothetical protein